jgi:hypothetical protein
MNEHPDQETKTDNAFSDLNRLNRLLRELDERGLILTLAAFAEDTLGDLLKAFLITGDATGQLLSGFNAPLGTLSARIKMAYALGLITKNQYDDLERLRKIRNEFAHNWEPVSFSDDKISSYIAALNFSSLVKEFPQSHLVKVRDNIAVLLMELRVVSGLINKNAQGAKLIGHHLFAGAVGDFDEQVEHCRKRLAELSGELKGATGDRRRFLIAHYRAAVDRFSIAIHNAPEDRRAEIPRLMAEHRAAARISDTF